MPLVMTALPPAADTTLRMSVAQYCSDLGCKIKHLVHSHDFTKFAVHRTTDTTEQSVALPFMPLLLFPLV
jgi:hypothetical protein